MQWNLIRVVVFQEVMAQLHFMQYDLKAKALLLWIFLEYTSFRAAQYGSQNHEVFPRGTSSDSDPSSSSSRKWFPWAD